MTSRSEVLTHGFSAAPLAARYGSAAVVVAVARRCDEPSGKKILKPGRAY